ncbi:MAG: hypothetical protein ACP5NV_04100 [Candidatus Woesearchaeota archaeon]
MSKTKIERKTSRARILAALLITILIFSLGLTLGLLIDTQRIQWSERESKEQRADYESLQWQYLFLTSTEDKEEMCLLLKAAFDKSVSDLGESLDRVQSYRKNSQINEKDYEIIERNYAIDNLKYWLLAKKYKSECGGEYVIILYFFSEKNCPVCPDQGVVLTQYKKIYDEKLLVFPINTDLQNTESSVKILQDRYNITYLPAIVVENKKYPGVVDITSLGDIICDNFENEESCIN